MDIQEKIQKFIKEKDFPTWYRELSDRQMHAADNLLNCIRDDSNQGTTHRVTDALVIIGLNPLVNTKRMRITMRMSQGNDLAFLWFLLELFYAKNVFLIHTPGSVYTINQQLILSTICHLDMITTLRELDKILPQQGNKSNTNTNKNNIKKERKVKNVNKIDYANISPYLMPLPKLVEHKRKCASLTPPKVKITPYERYADPVYVVANESNRWFADVNLDLSQVIGKNLNSFDIVRGLLFDEIYKMDLGNGDSIKQNNNNDDDKLLCPKHECEKNKRISQMLVDARKRCINYFFEDYNNNRNIVLKRNFEAHLKLELIKVKEEAQKLCDKFDHLKWIRSLIHDIINKFKNYDENETQPLRILKYKTPLDKPDKIYYNFGHFGRPKPREKYFHAPKEHTPYKIDYTRVFDVQQPVNNNSSKYHIRNSIDAALQLEKYDNEDDAICDWLRLTWQNEVKLSNEYEKKKRKEIEGLELIKANQYYDPKDLNLMRELLKTALTEMSKNPKYVLASLPDVYKLALLNNWIQARYGLIIKEKTRLKALAKTKNLLEIMIKTKMQIPTPRLSEISNSRYISYREHDKLLRKANQVLHKFYLKTKAKTLEDVRIYWAALEPYHCTNGPPRETFYAYMPSKTHDILPFRPWQPIQYRDFKRFREAARKK